MFQIFNLAPCSFAFQAEPADMNPHPRISVSFPAERSAEPLDGRVLVMFSTNDEAEPRFQIGDSSDTQQIFGVDVEAMGPGERVMIDGMPIPIGTDGYVEIALPTTGRTALFVQIIDGDGNIMDGSPQE